MDITIVSPIYRSESLVQPLIERIERALAPTGLEFEIVLVEDRGPDASWSRIEEACMADPRVRGIRLSRNFGQQPAIAAGLKYASGRWIVVMDGDLQDRPEEIPRLYEKAVKEGWQVVLARRASRQDPFFRRLGARGFYGVLSYLTDTSQDPAINAFGIYHREVISAIQEMGDYVRYLPTMVRWVGFRLTTLDVEHAPRGAGVSSYNWRRLFNLALDVIVAFSDKPMRLMVQLGILISVSASLMVLLFITQYAMGMVRVAGWASVFVSLWLVAGVLIGLVGVVGLYMGKTFEQAKQRPVFIVDQIRNLGEVLREAK